MGQLDGQVAVVTGAASGIGAAIADLFRSEGATLALFDLAEPSDEVQSQADVSTHRVDVTDAQSVRQAVEEVIAQHGRIDVLVSAAGILDEVPFLEMSPQRWEKTIAVDLHGVFLAARYVAEHMVAAGSGRIINIASQLGIKGGMNLAHYVAAKAGVIGLTKALAQELAPQGVLVNRAGTGLHSPDRRPVRRVEDRQGCRAAARPFRPTRRGGPHGPAAGQLTGRGHLRGPDARPEQRRRDAVTGHRP